MITGLHLMTSKKTEWVVIADVIQTSSTSKGNKEAAWQNGLRLQAAGPLLEYRLFFSTSFMYRPDHLVIYT